MYFLNTNEGYKQINDFSELKESLIKLDNDKIKFKIDENNFKNLLSLKPLKFIHKNF